MNESRLITPPLVTPSRARRAISDEIGKLRAEREEPRGGGESFIICFLFFQCARALYVSDNNLKREAKGTERWLVDRYTETEGLIILT